MCPSANKLILLYAIRRFLEVSVSLFLPIQRDEIPFFDTQVPVERQRPSNALPVHISTTVYLFSINMLLPTQEGWVVSCWNSPSSSNVLVCAWSPPLAALCAVSTESWLSRQGREVRNSGLTAPCPKQSPKLSDWWHVINCSLLAALMMEGAWTHGWSALNLIVRARHSPVLYYKGKVRLWTGWWESSPLSSGSL